MKKPTAKTPEVGEVSTLPMPLVRPTAHYQRRQHELTHLIEHRPPQGTRAWRDQCSYEVELEAGLRADFMVAFGLRKDVGQHARRFFWRWAKHHLPEWFDHVRYYRRGGNYVVVSQPYGADHDKLRRWCHENGAAIYGQLKDWAHYFPGHATLFYAEFVPWTAKQKREWARKENLS